MRTVGNTSYTTGCEPEHPNTYWGSHTVLDKHFRPGHTCNCGVWKVDKVISVKGGNVTFQRTSPNGKISTVLTSVSHYDKVSFD